MAISDVTSTSASLAMPARELSLSRVINARPAMVFRAWTEPALLKQWFAPAPWTTAIAETDVRAGGSSLIVMQSPDGTEYASRGVYLEVVRNEKLVFTDAYTEAWTPSDKPFMTVILTFDDDGGKTRYDVRVRHWSAADRDVHRQMGFHNGWAQCADQMEALLARLGGTAAA